MNEEKKKLAEENHNLIYWFLNKKNLPIDEYYDIASIGYCKAVESYDADKGNKLSVYAYKCMENEVAMHECLKLSEKNGRGKLTLSYDSMFVVGKDGDEENFLSLLCSSGCMEDDAIARHMLDEYLKILNARDRKVILLAVNGYTQGEIARETGISQSYVSRMLKKLIRYMKEE